MRRSPLPPALFALAVVLAGCAAPEATGPDGADLDSALPWRFADFVVPHHEHNVFEEHAVASPTMAKVAHHPLGADGKAYSYIGEVDSRAGRSAVAVVARGSVPGFVVLDTSDPARPVLLGRAEAPWAYGADVKLTDDGAFALLATQGNGLSGPPPVPGGEMLAPALRSGIGVYDLSDPAQPTLVHVAPVMPGGCHMISIGRVAGAEHVFCINDALTTFRFDRAIPALVPVGVYWPFGTQGYDTAAEHELLGVSPHDVTFQPDPLDGTPVVSVSHWDLGVAVLDVSDPAVPVQLLRWAGEGAEEYHGFVHSAQLTRDGDRRILVVSPETLDDVIPAIWFLDATDWDAPALAAEWINPGRHTSQGLLMTTHQWQIVGPRLYLAYNHNGVWVLDVPKVLAHGGTAPDHGEILGVFLPHDPVEVVHEDSAVPNVWDLNVVQGHILSTDRSTGLHVLRYAEDPTGAEWTSSA